MPISLQPNAGVIPDVLKGLAFRRIYGRSSAEAETLRLSDPAQRILKAAVGAGTLANVQWAGSLADMNAASNDFLSRLDGRSAAVALIDMGIVSRGPFNVPLITVATGATAALVGEGLPRPISKMSLGIDRLVPQKVQATVVLSKEVITEAGTAGQAFISRQLRIAVAASIDAVLIGQLLTGVTPITAGTSQAADLKKLLDAVNKGTVRLAWLAAPDVANRLAISNAIGGTSPTGISEAYGLPLFVSSGMAPGSLALINGDQVAGDVQGFGLEASDQATLNMDTAPTLPNAVTGAGASNMVSLWQENSIALGMTAIGDMAGAVGGVALLTGIAWTGA